MNIIRKTISNTGRHRIYFLGIKIASFVPKTDKKQNSTGGKDEKYQAGANNVRTVTPKRTPKEIFEYLLKYAKYTENVPEVKTSDKFKDCIWQLWLQGEENAPELVKKCLKSVKKHANGRRVIVLDEETVKDYIDVDSVIYEKYKQGLIIPAHFADYVRLELLAKYGGTWVDSTIMFTDPLPEEIINQDFFMFKTPAGMFLNNAPVTIDILNIIGGSWGGSVKMGYHLTSNWFIHSSAGNAITITLLHLFKQSLKEEEKLPDYFTFHYLFTIAVLYNDKCRNIYNKMTVRANIYPFYFLFMRWSKYTEQLWNEIKSYSTLHKLDYKTQIPPPDTLWGHVLANDINFN